MTKDDDRAITRPLIPASAGQRSRCARSGKSLFSRPATRAGI